MSFGDLVAERRKLLGLTQEEVASRASVGRGTLASIETGRQLPRARDMAPLLDAIAVPDSDWPVYVRALSADDRVPVSER